MTAVYTWDVFSTVDGYGSYDPQVADWGGYWSKQGPSSDIDPNLRPYRPTLR